MISDENSKEKKAWGITRRGFLKTIGGSAMAVAASDALAGFSTAAAVKPEETVAIKFVINGIRRGLVVEPRWTLLYVLREQLGITGTKPGCERGECGACTVLVNGVSRYACLTLAAEVDGMEITTVEGLMEGERLGPVQDAFVEHDAFQCGYCTSGQIMSAESLLRENSAPSEEEIRVGMSGNLCRCGAYPHIISAVNRAAQLKKGR